MSKVQQVIYEDNHLLIVNKMAGQLAQKDRTEDPDIASIYMPYIKSKYHKPGNVYLHPVHRLDRPVSGCLILARTSKASSRMSEAFRNERITKHYVAISDQRAEQEQGTLEHHLIKDTKTNRVKVARARALESKPAKLLYQLISSIGGLHLYHIKPITGRGHQIRVQMAQIGVPLLGDVKYGGSKTGAEQAIGLHCLAMTFEHPTLRQATTVRSVPTYPEYWKPFVEACQSIEID